MLVLHVFRNQKHFYQVRLRQGGQVRRWNVYIAGVGCFVHLAWTVCDDKGRQEGANRYGSTGKEGMGCVEQAAH